MITLTNELTSALIAAIHDAGIYSDELDRAIEDATGEEVGFNAPLDLVDCEYPTRITLTTTAATGDRLTVEYRTNAGTPDERTHIAGRAAVTE